MRRTPTSQSPVVGRTHRELRGDGPAVEHLATGTEAVNRRIARRLADGYCSSGPGRVGGLSVHSTPDRKFEIFYWTEVVLYYGTGPA